MTQKITYCLVSSRYDSETGAFVDTWHKDKLYDLSSKDDLKALAVTSVNLLAQGFKLSLKTYVERESLTFDAKALGIQLDTLGLRQRFMMNRPKRLFLYDYSLNQ